MNKFVIFASGILTAIIFISMIGWNKQLFDTTFTFDRAVISMPNGEVVDGKVTSWTDFEEGDQIQVKIDGKTYLVHSENVVLIAE